MKVSELHPGMRKVDVIVKVVKKSASRNVFVKRDGKSHQVVDLTVGDETGIVTMSLWDEMVNQIQENDVIKISNGYVGEWGNKIQLNIGKFGIWESLDPSEYSMDVYLEHTEAPSAAQSIKVIDCLRQSRGINLLVKVVNRLPTRQVKTQRDGMTHDVYTFICGDETGTINFSLWDQGDEIAEGEVLIIKGGYTREFNKVLALNLSRTGSYQKSDEDVPVVNTERNISEPSS
jgi:ssDNA-binding replication factor A large subunit